MHQLSASVTIAVLLAAVTHATWNAIAHGIKDQLLAFGLIGAGGIIVAIPLVILSPLPREACWPYLLASIAIHVVYNLLLMRSYQYGEFGQVYPLARGTSPLVVTILATVFVHERPALPQLAGVLVVSAGLALLVFAGRRPGRAALLAAVGTGLTIAAYTTVDGVGVRASGSPVAYIGWLMLLESLGVPLFALIRRRDILTRQPRRIIACGLLGGALSVLAYGLVLWAQTRGALAPIAALRETSVIFGAIIGTVAFREPFGRTRIAATIVVAAGIVLLNALPTRGGVPLRPGQNVAVSERTGASPIVIVGGGLAGGNAAATLREEGFAGPVVLISQEPGVPFGRPPLSKTYLRSEEDLAGWYVRPAGWYAEHDIDLRSGSRVMTVDAAAHTVVLRSGEELSYDKVLIASGGRNRRLGIPGAELPGIHYLRTVAECDAIKQEAKPGRRAVVVGMGFIGCEVAASLIQLGVQVTAVFPGRTPLEAVLGVQVGALIGAIHRTNGVELLASDQVASFEGTERLEAVVTAAGHRIGCDFAVAGIGIEPVVPAVAVAQENGILADELCRASAADVYVAGDVANHLHPLFGRIRVEHFNNAEKQGAAAARSMLGSTTPYDYIHSFWSDQYEHKIEYVGHAATWDEFVVRGSVDEGKLVGCYLVDGVVRAAVGLDRGGDPELDLDGEMAACARLVAVRARPAPGVLADERTDLWSLS